MPEFDKEAYWKNRKANKRGQGDEAVTAKLIKTTPSARRYKKEVIRQTYRQLKKDFKARQTDGKATDHQS